MPGPVITWSHTNIYADSDAVAWAEIAVPSGMLFSGGWAESANQYGPSGGYAAPHYSCTPDTPFTAGGSNALHGYGTGQHALLGTYIRFYDPADHTSQMYINYGFACDPGQQIRAHLYTVS